MKTTSPIFLSCSFCFVLALGSDGSNTASAENEIATPLYVEFKVEGLLGEPGTVEFSPDGKKVLIMDRDYHTVRLWDAESGKELQKLEGHHRAFSPGGKKMLTVSETETGSTTWIWDVESGKTLQKFKGWHKPFFPDGKKIVTEGATKTGVTTWIWDAESGKALQKFEGWLSILSPDEKKIVTHNIEFDKPRLWDTESGKELQKFKGHFGCFSPDGKKMITLDGKIIRLLDAESGKELQKFEGILGNLLPGGKKIVTMDRDRCNARLWDTDTGKELHKWEGTWQMTDLSPDGKKIAMQDTRAGNPFCHLYESESGKELQKFEGYFVAFSPDGKRIVTKSRDLTSTFRLWNVESGTGVKFEGVFAGFFPDGKKIAMQDTRAGNPFCHLYESESGKELQKFEGDLAGLSPDGKKIVTKSRDIVRIWDLSALDKQ